MKVKSAIVFTAVALLLDSANGHRLELAVNTQTPEEMAELRRVAPDMLDEWHQTRQAPRHAAWLHEKEFNPETV